MLLQSIYRKSKCLLQPHRSTCPNGRIQPSASKVCPLQYPPFLCCCKPFHKKDLSALLAGFFQQYAGFSICPYTTPKPVCANAALPPKGQSSISKGAHTVKNYLHCTGKLFLLHAFHNRTEAHACMVKSRQDLPNPTRHRRHSVRNFLVRVSFQSVKCASHSVRTVYCQASPKKSLPHNPTLKKRTRFEKKSGTLFFANTHTCHHRKHYFPLIFTRQQSEILYFKRVRAQNKISDPLLKLSQ